jgi:hypothetical protein
MKSKCLLSSTKVTSTDQSSLHLLALIAKMIQKLIDTLLGHLVAFAAQRSTIGFDDESNMVICLCQSTCLEAGFVIGIIIQPKFCPERRWNVLQSLVVAGKEECDGGLELRRRIALRQKLGNTGPNRGRGRFDKSLTTRCS